jgi:hypothetical protein
MINRLRHARELERLVTLTYYASCDADAWADAERAASEESGSGWAVSTTRDADLAAALALRLFGEVLVEMAIFDRAAARDRGLGWFWDRSREKPYQFDFGPSATTAPELVGTRAESDAAAYMTGQDYDSPF